MSEEENIPEDRSEVEGIRQKAESNEHIPETSPNPIPSDLNPVRTDIHPGGPQPLKEMEVHHHGHVHEKKKWKEYVFQFLMLFLAVTLGFFVENQREHYIENQRAKQYAGFMIADIKRDTSFFNKEAIRLLKLQDNFDTLISLLRQPVSASNTLITDQLFKINYVSDAKVIAATYNQMKSSGSLRYIKNPELIAGLQEYYEIQLPRCIRSSESSLDFFNGYILPFLINNIRNVKSHNSDTAKGENFVIIGRSIDADQRLSNVVEKAKTVLMIANRFYTPANKKAAEVIDMLEKEYHLK